VSASGPPSGVPDALREWMARFGGPGGAAFPDRDPDTRRAGEAAEAAFRALREAAARPGRDREGAFALLAADALLTEAARGLLAAEEPETALTDLLERVAGEEPE